MENEHHAHADHSSHHHEGPDTKSKPGPTHDHPDHSHHQTNGGMHDKHAGHHTEDFLKRFWICLILTIPVLLLSHMIQQWFGFDLSFSGDKYLLLLLGSI